MNIPSKIRFHGREWKVLIQESIEDDYGNQFAGLCKTDSREIIIRKEKDKKFMFSVFLHECWHAINSPFHQAYTHNMDFEEIQAENFSNFFMALIEENQLTFRFKPDRATALSKKALNKNPQRDKGEISA